MTCFKRHLEQNSERENKNLLCDKLKTTSISSFTEFNMYQPEQWFVLWFYQFRRVPSEFADHSTLQQDPACPCFVQSSLISLNCDQNHAACQSCISQSPLVLKMWFHFDKMLSRFCGFRGCFFRKVKLFVQAVIHQSEKYLGRTLTCSNFVQSSG